MAAGKSPVEIQEQIEMDTVNHSTKAMRHNAEKKTLEEVTNREKAAARSERLIGRKVLCKQERQAQARHTVKCNLMQGKRISKG